MDHNVARDRYDLRKGFARSNKLRPQAPKLPAPAVTKDNANDKKPDDTKKEKEMTEDRLEKVVREPDRERIDKSYKESNNIRPSAPRPPQGNGSSNQSNSNKEK